MERSNYIFSFYGDDFTGSTDVMETLTLHGLPSILFLKTPSAEDLQKVQLKRSSVPTELRAFGVAGISRSLDPVEMEEELDPILSALSAFRSDFFLYKICSTLDSSPTRGNIGTAIKVASRYFPPGEIPCIVGAPFLNRFVVFGNLFARLDNVTYRLDRHPVMSVHPITPMQESDIRLHLKQQTDIEIRNLDRFQMYEGIPQNPSDEKTNQGKSYLMIYDTLTNDDLEHLGRHLYENWKGKPQLIVGSSGISYGLARYMTSGGLVASSTVEYVAEKADQILVVAGSCSPVTARQIKYSMDRGFEGLRLDIARLAEDHAYLDKVLSTVADFLENGKSVIVYSALGPGDPSISQNKRTKDLNSRLGSAMGEIVGGTIRRKSDLRCVVVGGDTSGYVSRYLGIYALEVYAPIAPGAPLCMAHSSDVVFDGMEIALKGGQNGSEDYFHKILNGK
jgi:3-oxoisoapionate kinase